MLTSLLCAHRMIFPFSCQSSILMMGEKRLYTDDIQTKTTLYLFFWFCFDGKSLLLGIYTKRKSVCLCSDSLFNYLMPFKYPVVDKDT